MTYFRVRKSVRQWYPTLHDTTVTVQADTKWRGALGYRAKDEAPGTWPGRNASRAALTSLSLVRLIRLHLRNAPDTVDNFMS
ncbi:hypothetical protein HBI56_145510 [Parastagonospora nodorum]|nr:hypothetical protein HBH53_042150 [Parastagonospora nodorum]KAH4047455.1 hypothetical protein HBH49_174220 [Parastagonospora nodorum]KAH4076045.1 hypothetical protein HBH50_024920 [Parastagonospora nodorum]KAH4208892.1 hypothetical protein HBI95_082800 [Parastagonospora nodorum]KAH4963975.1 hypothetical protein HBI78_112040 [Parastagonospora nodorum]